MYRFTLRDVLWLTVVVAVSTGWIVDHFQIVSFANQERKWETRHQMLVEALNGYGWQVTWQELAIDPVRGKGGDVLFLEPPASAK